MKLKENSSAQKLRGAYYTPLPLAEMMVKLFAKDKKIKTVLEPSCGDGVFIDALDDVSMIKQLDNVTGIEIEKTEADKLKNKFKNSEKVNILNQDFFDYYEKYDKNKYDLILGNRRILGISILKKDREYLCQIYWCLKE